MAINYAIQKTNKLLRVLLNSLFLLAAIASQAYMMIREMPRFKLIYKYRLWPMICVCLIFITFTSKR